MNVPRWYWYGGFVLGCLLSASFLILALGVARSYLVSANSLFAVLYTLQTLWFLSLAFLKDPIIALRMRVLIVSGVCVFVLLALVEERFFRLLVPSVLFSNGEFFRPGGWSGFLMLMILSLQLGIARSLAVRAAERKNIQKLTLFVVSAFLTVALVWLFPVIGLKVPLQEKWYYSLMTLRGEHAPGSDDIVVISMPEADRNSPADRKTFLEMISAAKPKLLAILNSTLGIEELEDLHRSLPVRVVHSGWTREAVSFQSPIGIPTIGRGEAYVNIRRRLEPGRMAMYYQPLSYGRPDFGLKVAGFAISADTVLAQEDGVVRIGPRKIPLVDGGRALINHHRRFGVRPSGFQYEEIPFESWIYGNYGDGPFLSGGGRDFRASFQMDFKNREFLEQEFRQEKLIIVGKRQPSELHFLKNKIVVAQITFSLDRYFVDGLVYSSIIQNILDDDFIRESSSTTNGLLAVLLTGLWFLLYNQFNSFKALGLTALLLLLSAGFLVLAFTEWSWFFSPLPFAATAIGTLLFFFPVGMVAERSSLLKERARLDAELHAARDMQAGLLPKEDPELPGFEVSGICVPAHEVGGDFFDYVWLDSKKRKLGIAVADVSGKAMKAAITAVMTSGMIYQEVSNDESPKKILRNVNRPLYLRIDPRMFTAALFAVLDTKTRELRFSNAGQVHPLLKRGRNVTPLEVRGARLPLGVKEDVPYQEMSVKLRRGDAVVLYTDGVPEAMNASEEFFGFDRFQELVSGAEEMTAKQMIEYLVRQVRLFTSNAPQHDDMTIVVVKTLR